MNPKGLTVTTKLLNHLRSNAIAYLALFFAIGGGSVAVAATTASKNVIHACENTKTGELFVKARCGRGQRAVSWNKTGVAGPAGASADAFGIVGLLNSGVGDAQGLTFQQIADGEYKVTVTAPACQNKPQISTVTAQGAPSSAGTPIAYGGGEGNSPIYVTTGVLENGAFSQTSATGFTIQVSCGGSTSS